MSLTILLRRISRHRRDYRTYHHGQVVGERVAELDVRVRGFVCDHLGREVVREAVENQDRVHRAVLQPNNKRFRQSSPRQQRYIICIVCHTCSMDTTSGTTLAPWCTMWHTRWTSDKQSPRVMWPITGLLLLWSCDLSPQCSFSTCDSTRYTGSCTQSTHSHRSISQRACRPLV